MKVWYLKFTFTLATVAALVALLVGCTLTSQKRNTRSGNSTNQEPTPNPTAQSQDPRVVPRTHQFGVLDENFDFVNNGIDDLPTLRAKFPIRQDDSAVAVLGDGPDFLAARWQLLMQAQQSVRIQSLVFRGDESGWAIAEKLIELKKRGLSVQIIIDSVSNLEARDQSMYTLLQQNGIIVEGFEVYYLSALLELSKRDSLTNIIDRTNMRRHEKMFIIDAEIPDKARAIVGGVNIANQYFRIEPAIYGENWRDKDVILKGSIVKDLAKNFDENAATIEAFKNNQALLNADPIWKMALYLRDILNIKPLLPITDPGLRPALKQVVQNYIARSINLEWKPARMRFLESRPYQKEFFIHAAYVDAIMSARKEILILNSYFLPTEDMRIALKDAVRRGVNVKILTNDVDVVDIPMVVKAARMVYPELLAVNEETRVNNATLEIYEWGGHPKFGNKEGLHHAKYALFDDDVAIVGSFNLDPRSRNQNSECIVAFENAEATHTLRSEFIEQIGPNVSTPITLEMARSFKDPDGFLKSLESRFAEVLTPIL